MNPLTATYDEIVEHSERKRREHGKDDRGFPWQSGVLMGWVWLLCKERDNLKEKLEAKECAPSSPRS